MFTRPFPMIMKDVTTMRCRSLHDHGKGWGRRWRGWILAGVCLVLGSGCTADPDDADATHESPTIPRGGPEATAGPNAGDAVSPTEPTDMATQPDGSTTEPPAATDVRPPASIPGTAIPTHPVSLPALMQHRFDGRDLRVGEVREESGAYTQYEITYRSGDLTISGIMNVPVGEGPFPALVLAHGYIDPAVYTTGRGLVREQDHLARQGYVVLHTDYRNHASSDADPDNEVRLRLGYTEDVVNAVLALRDSSLSYIDGDRIGLLGRSMGGGIALNTLVVQPGLVDAAVIYASVSSDAVENFDRWTRGNPDAQELTEQIFDAYGAPEDNPEFWENVSPVTFVERITEPVLMHHGSADDTCPIEWAYDTRDALADAGKDVTLEVYEGRSTPSVHAGRTRSSGRSSSSTATSPLSHDHEH